MRFEDLCIELLVTNLNFKYCLSTKTKPHCYFIFFNVIPQN